MRKTDAFVRWCGVAALLLLLFPLSGFLRSAPTPAVLAVVFLLLAGFASLFAWVWVRAASARPWPFALWAVVTLATLAVVLNLAFQGQTRWLSLFVYVVPAAGFALAGRAGLVAVSLTVLLTVGTALAHPSVVDQLKPSLPLGLAAALPQLLLIGLGAAGVRRLIDTSAELESARDELARLAVEEERLRFARDLHDLLGHSLSVITIKAELAGRLLPDQTGAAAAEIGDIERVARGGLREVREAISGYRRPTLATELATARAALEAAGVECRVEDAAGVLPTEAEAAFAWAVREGATNVARHSRAHRCSVRLARHAGSVTLEVVDDGPGGEPMVPGYGLTGLRERVAGAGGQLDAGPLPMGGFRLRVTLPLRCEVVMLSDGHEEILR